MTPLTSEERARGPLYLLRYIDEQSAEIERYRKLITELADALEEEFGESRDLMQSQQRPWNIIQRAREATK